MYNVNPGQLIQMIKSGQNPQQLMLSVLENRIQNSPSPIGANLLNLARSGDTNALMAFARNYFQQQGVDFDKEFAAFRQYWGL